MNFFSPIGATTAGPSDAEGAARHLANLRALNRNMLADERADAYLRAERGLSEGAIEDLPAGAGAPMTAGLPTQAPAATFATTPVPDAQRNQYIARNVTPQAMPDQSDAESKRLASKAPVRPPLQTRSSYARGVESTLQGNPAFTTEQQRLDYLRGRNPVPNPAASGNESMAEANRLLSKGAPAAAARAPAVDAQSAIGRVLGREGGFVDDPKDRGGKTKFGISQKAYPKLDIANLTEQQAAAIYKRDYWDAINADSLPENIRELAFDAAVNQGVQWTKDALAASGGDPAKFLQMRRDRYQSIVAADESQAKFLNGWMNRLNEFGQAPVSQAPAAAPTQTTAAAGATQAPAPAAAGQAFSPEQVSSIAAAAQNDLRIKQLQLTEINRLLSVAPDAQTARQLREKAQEIRFGAFNAQLTNASAQALGGDERALSQLANAARVQYAQTPQGFVAVALGADGQYRPTTQPMSRERFINTLYSEASGAAAKLRAAQQEAAMKAQGEIAVKRVEGENAVRKAQADAQAAIQKAIAERQLTQGDVKDIKFNSLNGEAYVVTNSGVFSVQPGQDLGDGMMSEPQLVPLRGLAG